MITSQQIEQQSFNPSYVKGAKAPMLFKTNFCEWSCLTKKEYRNLSLTQKIIFNKICGVVI